MARKIHSLDLLGQRFGRWTVLAKSHRSKWGDIFWSCRCDCGNDGVVRAGNLRNGTSTSCGCYHKEAVTRHGMTHSRTWKSWDSMLQRCENPAAPDFGRYGGRGIKVCQQWHDFRCFLADMGERPERTTLERDNVNGNYEPGNCRWATASEQQRNKQNAIRLVFNGETKSVHDWAEQTGMPIHVLKWRIRQGWPAADVLSKPIRPKRPARKDL